MAKENAWTTIPISLTGPLDTRSRPADLGPGAIRWKLSLACNKSGKLCRRAGHAALNFGLRSDSPSGTANWDFHLRGAAREPITLLSEIVSPERVRYLFAGTEGRVDWLDNSTSDWTNIINSGSAGGRWKIAGLNGKAVLTNNIDPVQIHTLGSGTAATITDLTTLNITRAKVVVQYQNVIVLMNLTSAGSRLPNRIQWGAYRLPESFVFGMSSVAGFQDLDDGEEILNSGELAGVLWIFTDRAIWWMFPSGSTAAGTSVFGFKRWYAEPKNRTACLRYENSLVATGKEFFWLGESTIYWTNQFSSAPTSPDWLLKASGRLFEGPNRIDPAWCASPVGEFVPDAAGSAKEVWFSYPQLGSVAGVNNYSLVLSFNIESQASPYQTGDHVDYGYTALCNFTHVAGGSSLNCATTTTFIGASGSDYCLKSVGNVFYREEVTLIGGNVETDIPHASYARTQAGYFSEIRASFPLPAISSREKIVRHLQLDHDTVDPLAANSNVLQLKIGNSYIVADPLASNCAVLWHELEDKPLACPNLKTSEQLLADGLRSDDATEWFAAEQGIYLYYWIKIANFQGAAPVGSDSAWNNLMVDYFLLP